MRFTTVSCASLLALLSYQALTSPIRHNPRDVEPGAENAFHQATDGVESAWESTKHWFTGGPTSNSITLGLVKQGHQSCKATDNVFFISYTTIIGADYNATRCAMAEEKLKGSENVNAWRCVNDTSSGTSNTGRGIFKLKFNAGRNKEPGLNTNLTSVFEDINGFNCPGW